MDLKFSFGGASPDQHDHGGAPSGIPLPFAGVASSATSTSSELGIFVRLVTSPEGATAIAEVITGDGVTYTRSEVTLKRAQGVGGPLPIDSGEPIDPADTDAVMRAVRSAISRAVAALEGPLASAVTSIELDVPNADSIIELLGVPASGTVDDALQARWGVSAGTPVHAR
ncbi:hypothetical protein [Leucobacter komagatae]|uniref:Uncharacterized protein n=1 Tax=Leucobacter komagatae TaxID=55969 RepID=A0A0D0IQ37_9MICO|nr:hypothetical protein [Leucobacter komagatae]KIP53142.1 hypothetical protein SD72_04715 [Leucobacter komagatae]